VGLIGSPILTAQASFTPKDGSLQRIALGVSYLGGVYEGWQSQLSGNTVQDKLEAALGQFTCQRVSTLCAGRTDAGVHGLMQVVHFDTALDRPTASWVRGTNRYLPHDIAVQWAHTVPPEFHCRASAKTRRYAYVLLQSPVRPSVDQGRVGWSLYPLQKEPMRQAAALLIGEHDFSSFRAAACQALSPVKTLLRIDIRQRGAYWVFEFEASAFLHHMIRNIMGCLVSIGQGRKSVQWMQEVLDARSREVAAPTFSPSGLYFLGPTYDAKWGLPAQTPPFDFLP
jgi:tRNA pseudouridine38-40 synthase